MVIIPNQNVDFGSAGGYSKVLKIIRKSFYERSAVRRAKLKGLNVKKLVILLAAVVSYSAGTSWAASVELSRAEGRAGEITTLILSLNPLALGVTGDIALDLLLEFDPNKVEFVRGSEKKLPIFLDELDEGTNNPAIETFLEATPQSNNTLKISLGGFYPDPATAPSGGGIGSLDFKISNDAAAGDIPLFLTIDSSSSTLLSTASAGGISVASPVPVPPAFFLLGVPLAWVLAKRRAAAL